MAMGLLQRAIVSRFVPHGDAANRLLAPVKEQFSALAKGFFAYKR